MKKPRTAQRKRNQYKKKAGLPPGSIVHVGEFCEGSSEIEVVDYNAEHVKSSRLVDLTELYKMLESTNSITWVRINGIHDTETIGAVGNKIEIHPLVLEDIVNTSQRPKIESYEDYLFIVLKHLSIEGEDKKLVSRQISLILSKGCVFSFHEQDEPIFDLLKPRIDVPNGRFRKYGSDYLAYAIIDLIVDNYYALIEDMIEEAYIIEEKILDNASTPDFDELHQLRRKINFLRRNIAPVREIIQILSRDEHRLISDNMSVYLRDVTDHINRCLDSIDHILDVTVALMETHLARVNLRSGEVMKVLTIIATIFIPLTFIVGIYGMNFDPEASPYNMPELNWYYGYPISLAFMLSVTTGMLLYFRRKKWI